MRIRRPQSDKGIISKGTVYLHSLDSSSGSPHDFLLVVEQQRVAGKCLESLLSVFSFNASNLAPILDDHAHLCRRYWLRGRLRPAEEVVREALVHARDRVPGLVDRQNDYDHGCGEALWSRKRRRRY